MDTQRTALQEANSYFKLAAFGTGVSAINALFCLTAETGSPWVKICAVFTAIAAGPTVWSCGQAFINIARHVRPETDASPVQTTDNNPQLVPDQL